VLGIVGSALAAVSVERNGAMTSRRAFRASSAEIALTLQIAIQHERDLIVSASGFVIGNPNATNAQYRRVGSLGARTRALPELASFGHAVVVPAAGLPAFAARAVRTRASRGLRRKL